MIKYPYSRPQITRADAEAVNSALMSGDMLTQGPQVAAFEREFSAATGNAEVITCSNATVGLHMAYLALGLGPDAGLITSPVTFLSTANAARMCGAPVAFADVDPRTGLLDPQSVRRLLQAPPFKVAAITVVHLGGLVGDMAALRAIADEYGVALVEDACHAVAADYQVDGAVFRVGGCEHSDMAVFSFHAIKHIAMGEGGAVTTRDAGLAHKLRQLRSHGMVRDASVWQAPPEETGPWYYEMAELGYNYRLTDLQCALGRSQLSRFPAAQTRRRAIADRYDRLLADLPHVATPVRGSLPGGHALHLYALGIDFAALGTTRADVMRRLGEQGVGSQVHYIPLYRQPYYQALGLTALPGAEHYYQRTLSIPLYPDLTDDDVAGIAATVTEILRS